MANIKKSAHDIPGFSRYEVRRDPFEIVNKATGRALTPFSRGDGRGHQRVQVVDDNGKRLSRSVIVLAALAWHGVCPPDYEPYWTGGEIVPASVRYIPCRQARAIRRRSVSEWERLEVCELYFGQGWTQKRIAQKFRITQSSVCRMVNQKGLS